MPSIATSMLRLADSIFVDVLSLIVASADQQRPQPLDPAELLSSRGQVQRRQSTRHVFRLRAEQCNGKLRPRRRILHAPQPVEDLLQPFTSSRATLSELTRHVLVPEADLLERLPGVLVARSFTPDREVP